MAHQVDGLGALVEQAEDVLGEQLDAVRAGPVASTMTAKIHGVHGAMVGQPGGHDVPVLGGGAGAMEEQHVWCAGSGAWPDERREGDPVDDDAYVVGHARQSRRGPSSEQLIRLLAERSDPLSPVTPRYRCAWTTDRGTTSFADGGLPAPLGECCECGV